jgi:D-3-phosphoglycerate dehydrogenase / 2-oxoglutarate reductase
MIKKVHSDQEILDALNAEFCHVSKTVTQKKTILISAPYMQPNATAFRTFLESLGYEILISSELLGLNKERLEEEDLLQIIGLYDIALIGDDRYTRKVLQLSTNNVYLNSLNDPRRNKRLLGLMKWGTGIDSIDLEAACEYGVVVKNTPDAFSEPVAESLIGSILAFNRGLFQSTNLMREMPYFSPQVKMADLLPMASFTPQVKMAKDANSWVKIPCKTIRETSFGIIGVGNVGRAVIHKLLLLGATKIFTYDLLGFMDLSDMPYGTNVSQTNSLTELLKYQPDFLLVTCSQNKDNIKMISDSELALLERGKTVVVNMARGTLIDEPSLIRALMSDETGQAHLAGAALDVYWHEPLPADSMLRKLPNVILTSHNANSSPLYWLKVHLNTIRNTLSLDLDG